jgi:hypothetical protein
MAVTKCEVDGKELLFVTPFTFTPILDSDIPVEGCNGHPFPGMGKRSLLKKLNDFEWEVKLNSRPRSRRRHSNTPGARMRRASRFITLKFMADIYPVEVKCNDVGITDIKYDIVMHENGKEQVTITMPRHGRKRRATLEV